MREHPHRESARINPELSLASVDLFNAVLAARFGRLGRLGVQDTDRCSGLQSGAFTPVCRAYHERSITTPLVKRGANGAYRQNINRKQPPLAVGAMFGGERIDDRTQIDLGGTTAFQ